MVFSFVAVHVSVRERVTAFLAQLDLIEVQQKSDLASQLQLVQESQARTRILTTLKAQLAAKGSLPRRRLFWFVFGQPCILAVRDFSTRLFRLDQSDTSAGETLLGACAFDDAECACFGRDLVSLWSVHLGRDVVSLWSVVQCSRWISTGSLRRLTRLALRLEVECSSVALIFSFRMWGRTCLVLIFWSMAPPPSSNRACLWFLCAARGASPLVALRGPPPLVTGTDSDLSCSPPSSAVASE